MKKIIYIMLASVAMLISAGEADAQMGKRHYINAGWQFNGTLANDFAQSAQGYGAFLQAGYYVSPMIAVGGFASFGTNVTYAPKTTYRFEDGSALTTDLYKSIYQVPFGASVRLRFLRHEFQPYFEAKVGTEYSTQSTYLSAYVNRHDNWGFYVSPEIGLTFFPFYKADVGFQFAAYYSYSTNRNDNYGINGLNNLGFKVGIAF